MHIDSLLFLLVGWTVFGAVIGLIARAVMPGRQRMGWVSTIALGVVGSFVGGMLGNALFGGGEPFSLHTAGWFGSLAGALVILMVIALFTLRRPLTR